MLLRSGRHPVGALSKAGAIAGVLLAGCGGVDPQPSGEVREPVIYGTDDRQECDGLSSVALIYQTHVDATDPMNVRITGNTLQAAQDLCPNERFLNQLEPAFCSGSLIADDLVLTAGHCMSKKSDCPNTRFVFGYAWDTVRGALKPVTSADVFRCTQVVVSSNTATMDYAVVRLDRPAAPRFPVMPINTVAAPLAVNTPLRVIGYPSGIPCKVDEGGWVREPHANTLDFFVANLDVFAGNSGSAVYDRSNGSLVGILVRGETDYVRDKANRCNRTNVCPNDGCRGEDATYAFRAVEALCGVAPVQSLCGGH